MFQTTSQIKRSNVETGYPLLLMKRAIDNRLSQKTWWFFMAMLDCTLWSTMENRPFTCDLLLRKWWFSTAMLVYTRVDDLFFFFVIDDSSWRWRYVVFLCMLWDVWKSSEMDQYWIWTWPTRLDGCLTLQHEFVLMLLRVFVCNLRLPLDYRSTG